MNGRAFCCVVMLAGWASLGGAALRAQDAVELPEGVQAVWDLEKAQRDATPTRERVCLNGLWRWQPVSEANKPVPEQAGENAKPEPAAEQPPTQGWGYLKVPSYWPAVHAPDSEQPRWFPHPAWDLKGLRGTKSAWYQREIEVPEAWKGRRIALRAEYLNSYAVVYLDGKQAGEARYPACDLDLTAHCKPGQKQSLSLLVVALPLKGVMTSYHDTNTARTVKGSVSLKGLCGDVFLESAPAQGRIADLKVDTSVRKGEIQVEAELQGLAWNLEYTLHAKVSDGDRAVAEFSSTRFILEDLKFGRIAFGTKWKPEKLWDLHTPQHMHHLEVTLRNEKGAQNEQGETVDVALPVRFGFREFWIEGRDFYLNGTRIFLSGVPLDNAQTGVYAASYEGAKETLLRMKSWGNNFTYTHNYGCDPGSHLGFGEILRAADDAGMLVSFSQPHFSHYDWDDPYADWKNGYSDHARFYVQQAGNHPAVAMYAMNHNAGGYTGDMDPDKIDGATDHRNHPWSRNTAQRALRAEALVRRLDPGRVIYHHSSGNLGSMWTCNFYPNFVPIQELSDWFGHWATAGKAPAFTCEYGAPFTWDFTMYRGFFPRTQADGKVVQERVFGSAVVPWEFSLAEWNAQFLGDAAYKISERDKANLRWETEKLKAGKEWHRWDYPTHVGSRDLDEQFPVIGQYYADNWPAFRTWGVSAISAWQHHSYWKLREGADTSRKALPVDWARLQKPGFSADYIENISKNSLMSYAREDWVATPASDALQRYNMPLLAYLAGKPGAFTSKDHLFTPGERFEKQLVLINNSRLAQDCECAWSLNLPQAAAGSKKLTLPTGGIEKLPLRFELPADLPPGSYELSASVRFGNGETQKDTFAIRVLPAPPAAALEARIALFDPRGETAKLLNGLGAKYTRIEADADLAGFELLIVGKAALDLESPAPDLAKVRDGLKVVVFEQTSQALERRLGFRVQEYGLRQVFARVPGHALLAGLDDEALRDWRGSATLLPERLSPDYNINVFKGSPTVPWCGLDVPRLWRCGNRGNVASVPIEKPACGDFLALADGGFSQQYAPLLEYREGQGMALFCQLDVTGRTEADPAAETLARNILSYAARWKPKPRRAVLYAGAPEGLAHLKRAGFAVSAYAGGSPKPDQLLAVGPGGGAALSAHGEALAAWLKSGGRLLALGLDEKETGAFLPFKVGTRTAEHLAAYFERAGAESPFAGLGPADVHCRNPRELPLITEGATPLANGVLAQAQEGQVVFCQLVPWSFEYKIPQHNKRTFRRASCLVSRLLGNLDAQASTLVLERFKAPVKGPERRWLEGLYLDEPEIWDDPYRAFRW
ncbi:MAG: hypothetical protein M5U26_27145 [Planctomycetota bacterium]|nr:hypothetical protein [Planctomycetota bacterium]